MYQEEVQKKKEKKEELQNLVSSLVQEEKLTKTGLAEMIYSVMQDHNDPKMKLKGVKVLVRTLLKSGSLIPRVTDPEQIIHL